MNKYRMLDLFSGLGGASQAMIDRGWDVIRLDNESSFEPDILTDIMTWDYAGLKTDLIWASPPCNEFSRESMPWCKTGKIPSLKLFHKTLEIIRDIKPMFWIIENVAGARPYFGKPTQIIKPYYLWGQFPPITVNFTNRKKKESFSSTCQAQRAKIPYQLSFAICMAVEKQRVLKF